MSQVDLECGIWALHWWAGMFALLLHVLPKASQEWQRWLTGSLASCPEAFAPLLLATGGWEALGMTCLGEECYEAPPSTRGRFRWQLTKPRPGRTGRDGRMLLGWNLSWPLTGGYKLPILLSTQNVIRPEVESEVQGISESLGGLEQGFWPLPEWRRPCCRISNLGNPLAPLLQSPTVLEPPETCICNPEAEFTWSTLESHFYLHLPILIPNKIATLFFSHMLQLTQMSSQSYSIVSVCNWKMFGNPVKIATLSFANMSFILSYRYAKNQLWSPFQNEAFEDNMQRFHTYAICVVFPTVRFSWFTYPTNDRPSYEDMEVCVHMGFKCVPKCILIKMNISVVKIHGE